MSPRPRNEEAPPPRETRALRPRPTPKWLLNREDLDQIARRRCLCVLSVLSGERAVTEVIGELEISRGTYYQWEEKALQAILMALSPGSDAPGATGATERLAEMEGRVTALEREKRRAERLLLLTRKVMKPGPVTTGAGRPPKAKSRASGSSGKRSSSASGGKKKPTRPAPPSTPTPSAAAP